MLRRDFLKSGAAVAAASAALGGVRQACAAGKPQQLKVLTWGGPWSSTLKAGVDAAFTQATGIAVVHETTLSAYERVEKLKAALANQTYDVVQLTDEVWPYALLAGVVEPLDRNSPRLVHLKEVYPRFVHPYWVAQNFTAMGVAYNTQKLRNPLTGFADLWRPDLKGQLALPGIGENVGIDLIPIGAIATGKPASDAEAGFAALQKLVAQQPIWSKDLNSRLQTVREGRAAATVLYAWQLQQVQSAGSPIRWVYPKEGAISFSWGSGVAKGTPNKEWAEAYIDQTLDAKNQAGFSKIYGYAGTNSNALGQLPPDVQARVRLSADELNRLIQLDEEMIAKNRKAWTDRWRSVGAG